MDILVSEVGPRDGLQNVKRVMPTEAKKVWIDELVAAGLGDRDIAVSRRFIASRDIASHDIASQDTGRH